MMATYNFNILLDEPEASIGQVTAYSRFRHARSLNDRPFIYTQRDSAKVDCPVRFHSGTGDVSLMTAPVPPDYGSLYGLQ